MGPKYNHGKINPDMSTPNYDTIIVGGGIAGLTAAAYLSRAGQNVALFEKNKEFGGLVNTFTSDGFHFEAGVRALESAGIILPMLSHLDIRLEVVRSKVSIGIEGRILHIEDLNSVQEYRNMLVSLYPESEGEIDNFIQVMRKIMKMLDVLYGIENPLFKDLIKDRKYIFRKLLPWLPGFLFTVRRINRLNVPFEAFTGQLIKNQSLKDIITQHFFKGTPAFFALSYFSLYLDYFYPKGGVGKIVEEMLKKIDGYAGTLKPGTSIEKIIADEQLVVDNHGQRYHYQHLIWAADLKTFYENTLPGTLDARIQEKFETAKNRIRERRGSESVFSLYLEVDLPISYFSAISHGHFFYTPCRKGLGTLHRDELSTLLGNWENTEKADILVWVDRFLKNNTFEISIPGIKDPDLVPAGKSGLIISFIIEYKLFKKLEESGWYEEVRNEIEVRIINILSESVYPLLKERVLKHFSITPISIKNRIASTDGAIVGWSFEEPIPVVNKIQRSDKSVLTPLPNIFQAGQWAYSPAGVPMSILTGKLAADRVIKKTKN
jgi:phytoene dehydrogenase-like protein